MINLSSVDAHIALGGVCAGMLVGGVANIRKTGSLFNIGDEKLQKDIFATPEQTNSKKVTWLSSFEQYREKAIHGHNIFFDPVIPLEQILPLALVGIHHIIKCSRSPEATCTSLLSLGATYTFKVIMLPLAYNLTLITCSKLFRTIFTPVTELIEIDPSGHCVVQISSAFHKIFTFSALSQLGVSANLYRVTASVTSLADGMWVYRTTATYHSVMDMVVGTFFVGLSLGSLYKAQPVISHQASRVVESTFNLDVFKKNEAFFTALNVVFRAAH